MIVKVVLRVIGEVEVIFTTRNLPSMFILVTNLSRTHLFAIHTYYGSLLIVPINSLYQ
jgi:hypothetical protein